MKKDFWTVDSFGAGYIPENYEEIISMANDMIAEYAKDHNEEEMKNFSETLFERYCMTEEI